MLLGLAITYQLDYFKMLAIFTPDKEVGSKFDWNFFYLSKANIRWFKIYAIEQILPILSGEKANWHVSIKFPHKVLKFEVWKWMKSIQLEESYGWKKWSY